MAPSAFERLYEVIDDSTALAEAYDGLLSDLFKNSLWKDGPIELRRVPWNQARRARNEDAKAFASPGLYLWGVENRPLYFGITRGSFGERFSRYIWQTRSQCNLAQTFEAALISDGIDGFPPKVRDWYARNFGSSQARLRGAVRFATEGIARIWFTLFPHNSASEIERLERAVVPVAEAWNHDRSLRPLLNVEFNRGRAKREA